MGSKLNDLVHVICNHYEVCVVVCQMINSNLPHTQALDNAFNAKATLLRQYLYVVLAEEQDIFVCEPRKFSHPDCLLLSSEMMCTVIHRNSSVCTGAIARPS